jgi:hypothetical protein
MSFVFQKKFNSPINEYTIIGERHSGTKLIEKIIRNNTSLPLTWKYGWKHWFGFADHIDLLNAKNTLFICMIRNPYDWIFSFYNDTHHVPKSNTNSFDKFIYSEWYSIIDPVFSEIEILEDRNFLTKNRYKNIFELRKYKLHYIRQVLTQLCPHLIILNYEKLTQDPQNTINSIKNYLKIDTTQENIFRIIPSKKHKHINQKNIEKINQNIDWEIENTVGYKKNSFI